MEFSEVIFKFSPNQPWNDILIAYLSELEFDSFQEFDAGLKGYIDTTKFNLKTIESICNKIDCHIEIEEKLVKKQNWNAEWESDFQPILIDNRCGIRADFHESLDVDFEIVITPKMSFGTGHHATTEGMIIEMLDISFNDKKVLDMGCGTAVLAILAKKLGANTVLAIDIEEWAFENAKENIFNNQCIDIDVIMGDKSKIKGNFDIVLANINRNILLDDISTYSHHMQSNSLLLLSGFYFHDLNLIKEEAKKNNLRYIQHITKDNWVIAKFEKY
ncbi:MAG: 50S ribosomal protein L11 methyltransferase [Flavobacteriales bacterium]